MIPRSARRLPVVLLAALAGVIAAAAVAQAEYGPGADPVSVDYGRLEQGDDATTDADISADGRYVVMQTRATNFFADDDPDPAGILRRGGIFRFDRVTKRLALVADGDMYSSDDGTLALRGAAKPSVSANGRFVAFSTAQRLVPQDTNDNLDVYVRDMNVPVGTDRAASNAYTLVSARDGGDVPASYAPHDPVLPGRNPGADVWANTAISADGTRVVFQTSETSDLPDHAAVDVPAGQVLVRDLTTHSTRLMTRQAGGGAPAGGAAGPAVLSGDGSTVVWAGGNTAGQTAFLPGERSDANIDYYLWRRVDGAITRRITGMADLDDPACNHATVVDPDPLVTGPCYGPLSTYEEEQSSLTSTPPAVSQDGYRIAFLTAAGRRPAVANNPGLDLFVTDMHPGLSRKASTTELTRDGNGSDPRGYSAIQAVAMAADGRHLVIATARDDFLLPILSPIGAFRSQPDTIELYAIDLQDHTIDRVVRAYYDADASGDAGLSPTMSADGALVAFTSRAGNLFYGDANSREDAFVATRQKPDTSRPPTTTDETPPPFEQTPDLETSVKRRTDGALDVRLKAPEAGTVLVTASASVARTRAGSTKVVVSQRSLKVTKKGIVRLTLRLASRYTKLLRKASRLAVTVTAAFTPADAKHSPTTDAPIRSSFTKKKKKTTKKAKRSSTTS